MPKFEIEVCRIGYGARTISVEAETLAEAEREALDSAGDYEFSEHDADYGLTSDAPLSITNDIKEEIEEVCSYLGGEVDDFVGNFLEGDNFELNLTHVYMRCAKIQAALQVEVFHSFQFPGRDLTFNVSSLRDYQDMVDGLKKYWESENE